MVRQWRDFLGQNLLRNLSQIIFQVVKTSESKAGLLGSEMKQVEI